MPDTSRPQREAPARPTRLVGSSAVEMVEYASRLQHDQRNAGRVDDLESAAAFVGQLATTDERAHPEAVQEADLREVDDDQPHAVTGERLLHRTPKVGL